MKPAVRARATIGKVGTAKTSASVANPTRRWDVLAVQEVAKHRTAELIRGPVVEASPILGWMTPTSGM